MSPSSGGVFDSCCRDSCNPKDRSSDVGCDASNAVLAKPQVLNSSSSFHTKQEAKESHGDVAAAHFDKTKSVQFTSTQIPEEEILATSMRSSHTRACEATETNLILEEARNSAALRMVAESGVSTHPWDRLRSVQFGFTDVTEDPILSASSHYSPVQSVRSSIFRPSEKSKTSEKSSGISTWSQARSTSSIPDRAMDSLYKGRQRFQSREAPSTFSLLSKLQSAKDKSVSFLDTSFLEVIDERFRIVNENRMMKYGSRFLMSFLAYVFCSGAYSNLQRGFEHTRFDCDLDDTLGLRLACLGSEALTLLCLAATLCYSKGRRSLTVYFLFIGMSMFYSLVAYVPPFALSCNDLIEFARCTGNEFHYSHIAEVGCGMPSTTTMMISMSWGALLPHILPRVEHVAGFAVIHLVGWVICNTISDALTDHIHDWVDILIGCAFLVLTSTAALFIKVRILKLRRGSFRLKYAMKEFGKDMFHILEYMVPLHVVVPMLTNTGRTIAEHSDIASILFVVIDSFDEQSRSWDPTRLLNFLNVIFSELDAICEFHNVPKIETVSEEYVAAVGVHPKDEDMDALDNHHSEELGNLIRVAIDVILLQQDGKFDATFRMGISTGPVVAGVIGDKLPRYRLFGDTINTAARMMQKSLPGEVQFGDQTKAHLPSWVCSEARGPIELKGKGMVETHLLDWRSCIAQGNLGFRTDRSTKISGLDLKNMETLSVDSEQWSVMGPRIAGHMRHTHKFVAAMREAADIVEKREVLKPNCRKSSDHLHSKSLRRCMKCLGLHSRTAENTEFHDVFYRLQMTRAASWASVQGAIFLGLTLLELLTASIIGGVDERHEMLGVARYTAFIICRVAILTTIGLWWVFVLKAARKISIRRAEDLWLIMGCMLMFFLFISYEALTPKLHEFIGSEYEGEIKRILDDGEHRIRIWPLMFFAVFYCIVFNLSLPTRHSIFLVCFVSVLVFLGSRRSAIREDFNMRFEIDQCVCFLIIGVVGVDRSRSEKRHAKSTYRVERSIAFMNTRVEAILNSLLPPLVLEEIQGNKGVAIPGHGYKSATIVQSDLVGFTELISTRSPIEAVEIISEIFGMFDNLTDKYDLCKVETVGDAYIAGQAEPPLTLFHKPLNVLKFAAEIIRATQAWSKERQSETVDCRVGVHTGPCVGGIVGMSMQRYHLFGSLLSILSNLEATSKPGLVHISNACMKLVAEDTKTSTNDDGSIVSPDFIFERRAGELTTSKGESVDFEAVGGQPSYFASPTKRMARHLPRDSTYTISSKAVKTWRRSASEDIPTFASAFGYRDSS